MPLPLGNPTDQAPISVTDASQEVLIPQGTIAVDFQNTGANSVYYGQLATLTAARGYKLIAGETVTFIHVPTSFKIAFICDTGLTSTIRQINYI